MRKLVVLIVLGILVAACGSSADSDGDGGTDEPVAGASGTLDPCTLADESVMSTYFGEETIQGEPSETGPIDSCRWRDANANSLLIQVASNYELHRPDPCDGCVDLDFGDDGFAVGSPLQSTAKLVAGDGWYSVTTTGFGDDAASIAGLAETIFGDIAG